MSEALNYLLKIRPDVMGDYFSFIKKAGGSLDAKTKAIISVITKIDNQTEKGFKQYLKRALQEGVSANEIIDAMLVAFPTLGLTKIVWAMDILLQMDLPEFAPENLTTATDWHAVMDVSAIQPGETIFTEIDDKGIFIHKSKNNEVLVFDQRCPHQATPTNNECLDDNVLTCPKHGWQFDISSGDCVNKGDKPLTRIEHKIENNQLWVYL